MQLAVFVYKAITLKHFIQGLYAVANILLWKLKHTFLLPFLFFYFVKIKQLNQNVSIRQYVKRHSSNSKNQKSNKTQNHTQMRAIWSAQTNSPLQRWAKSANCLWLEVRDGILLPKAKRTRKHFDSKGIRKEKKY